MTEEIPEYVQRKIEAMKAKGYKFKPRKMMSESELEDIDVHDYLDASREDMENAGILLKDLIEITMKDQRFYHTDAIDIIGQNVKDKDVAISMLFHILMDMLGRDYKRFAMEKMMKDMMGGRMPPMDMDDEECSCGNCSQPKDTEHSKKKNEYADGREIA